MFRVKRRLPQGRCGRLEDFRSVAKAARRRPECRNNVGLCRRCPIVDGLLGGGAQPRRSGVSHSLVSNKRRRGELGFAAGVPRRLPGAGRLAGRRGGTTRPGPWRAVRHHSAVPGQRDRVESGQRCQLANSLLLIDRRQQPRRVAGRRLQRLVLRQPRTDGIRRGVAPRQSVMPTAERATVRDLLPRKVLPPQPVSTVMLLSCPTLRRWIKISNCRIGSPLRSESWRSG